jgi:hypothetical protein
MTETLKEKSEKKKALKKLVTKWLSAQGTKGKARMLLAKKPAIKKAIANQPRKPS